MELPNIGQQCDAENCKQLDFLPLTCKCGKIFCTDHFNVHVKECSQSKYLDKSELKTIDEIFVCSQTGCSERSIVEMLCERCKKHFCIKHRHLNECTPKSEEVLAMEKEKYYAPVRQFNEAKANVDEQIDASLQQAKKKTKNRATAAKVQLMRIKNKATGLKTIPTTNRIYFNVIYSSAGIQKSNPVFVSDQWSLGRAIDAIADECKLKNSNNKSSEKKLRLFKVEDGQIISEDMAVSMQQLLRQEIVIDGDNLLMTYV